MENPSRKWSLGKLFGAAIVLVWLVLIGVLIARQHVTQSEPPEGPIPPALLEEQWMTIRFQGQKVGWGHTEYKPIEGGYQVTGDSRLSIVAMGITQRAETSLEAEVSPEFYLKKFSFDFRSSAQNIHVEGEVTDNTLNVNIESPAGAKPDTRTFKLTEPISLLDTATMRAGRDGLKVGQKIRVPSFDPTTQSMDAITLDVVGREEIESMGKRINAFVLKTSFLGVEVRSWVDDDGRTLRDESPMGFVSELVTKAEALKVESAAKLDIVAQAAIPSNRMLENASSLRYMKVKLSGVEDIQLDTLNDCSQTAVNAVDGVIVSVSIPDLGPGYDLPDKDASRKSFIEPEALLQSDDPEIIAAAKNIAAGQTNSVAVARLLNEWLYKNIAKQGTLSLPSAREVWQSKKGDCNEHTVLYTALARSLGLPTRMAAGVVYLEGSFYYHAWPEAWLGDEAGWVPVDPTLGQFPASAARIRLIIGPLKDQLAISRFLGKLRVEILEP